MPAGENGKRIGSDLVGGVAVRRNPVRADNDRVHVAAREDASRRAVGNEHRPDPLLHKFPSGEPCALEQRARLVDEHADDIPPARSGGNDRKRGPFPRGCQSPRVAVRQERGAGGNKIRAALTDGSARCNVLPLYCERLGGKTSQNRLHGHLPSSAGGPFHPPHRCKEVHRGRARR